MPQSPAAGCPIRKSALQRVFAPGRGLSQLVTSFFASESQGILHVPFSPFRFSFPFSEFCLYDRLPAEARSPFASASCLYGRTSLRIHPQVALVCLDSLICSFNRSQLSSFRIQLPSIVASSMSMYSFFEWRITDSNR